jgi:alkanesulfonate monooxygenase SsuD/methylene tetrahydromethanopterin reductase-like flavin-dependent oxidoreductase (luciferase family)
VTAGGDGLRVGISFGALYGDVAEMAALGAEAEAGGFDALWVPDSPMLYRDPYATLAALAGRTRRVALGTLATNPATRHPAVTASALLTVHELSGGRARLGIASGDSAVRRLGAAPAPPAALEGAVRTIRALVAGTPDGEGGSRIRFARAAPPPPVYVVASGWRALEVAGRVADGVVLSVGVHPAVLAAALERVRAAARRAGRDPAELAVVAFAFCALAADPALARARLKPSVSWFCLRVPALAEAAGLPLGDAVRAQLRRFDADYARYDLVHAEGWARAMREAAFLPDAYVDAFALGGPPAEVAARLRAIHALGIREAVIRPCAREDWADTMRSVAAAVLPALRERAR